VQYAWNYVLGNQLAFTSIPDSIVGTAGAISTASPVVALTNTFNFTIVNNTANPQTIYYGYLQVNAV
jgi:hypothetical protein